MNIVCVSCQVLNCFLDDCSVDGVKCGCCGYDFFDGDVINVIGVMLDKFLKDDLLVVVDFWVLWCGFCCSFVLIFEDVVEECSGKMCFVKVNIEVECEFSVWFCICSILIIMMFKNGEVIDMFNGVVLKVLFDSWFNEVG